ncbi:hypothetical protein LguiA_034303 [Lonicera macranthoides]
MDNYSASSRAPVTLPYWQILASYPSTNFYLGGSHGAPDDDNLSLALTLYKDPWKIKKVLTTSDVDGSCRLLLSTKAVEKYVFSSMDENDARLCRTGIGKKFVVWDADQSFAHTLFLKKWANTKYFVLTSNWKKNFVTRKGLKKGDKIGLAWDGAKFYFKLLNRNGSTCSFF